MAAALASGSALFWLAWVDRAARVDRVSVATEPEAGRQEPHGSAAAVETASASPAVRREEQEAAKLPAGTGREDRSVEAKTLLDDRLRRLTRVQVNGQLVDPAGQPLDWEALRAALPGEPIDVRILAEESTVRCLQLPGGAMRGVITAQRETALPPVAMLELAGMAFRAKVDLATREPFRLGVDLDGLTEACARVTVRVRPLPVASGGPRGTVLLQGGGVRKESPLDGDGRALFATLTHGHWLGVVDVDGAAATPFQVTVAARERKEIVVELERAIALSGRTTFVDGTPIQGAMVTAERRGIRLRADDEPEGGTSSIASGMEPYGSALAAVDVDGEFEFLALPAGDYLIQVHGELHGAAAGAARTRLHSAEIRLGGRERERLDLVVDRSLAAGGESLTLALSASGAGNWLEGAEQLSGLLLTARFLDVEGHELASELEWIHALERPVALLRPLDAVEIEIDCWQRRGDHRLLPRLGGATKLLPPFGAPRPRVAIELELELP